MDCLMNRRVVVSVLIAVFVVGSLASPAIAQASTDAVLVMHFDEGSGTIVKDESGYGNDGTIYGATWTTGISEKALSFDGSNDYVEVADSETLDITDAITIEAWIYPISYPKNKYHAGIVGKGGWDIGSGYEMLLGYDEYNGPLQLSTGRSLYVTNSRVPLNQWTHVAATFDNIDAVLYLNGNITSSRGSLKSLSSNSRPVQIGRRDPGNNFVAYLDGIIDEVAIYSKALTPEEIKAHYLAKRAGSPTTALSLTKTASPYSIKQEQKTTVKITVENTGTTTIKDIDVVDTPPADFDFVSGDTSTKYGTIKPGESRTFQYTLRSGDTGKFDLGQATATYADEEGNYHTVKSNSPMVEVMAPLEKPEIPTGEEGEKKGVPGFEAVVAIAGLLAVAYLLRRGRR